ncbi:MAG: porin, partial [Proteobacteria bacterium]|nr:porin [Pseudomonadota bacterium]
MSKSFTFRYFLTTFFALSIMLMAMPSWSDEDVNERIDTLEQELLELKKLLKAQSEAQEATLEKLEVQKQAVQHIEQKTSGVSDTYVGGYGEINYLNYDGSTADEFDMQRFILFLGHKFDDKTRLYSEIEFEHAQVKGGESGGEVAIEQAYIEHALGEGINFRAGMQIIPIGLLNEYHEPPVFYGVERNEIETRIIPSTWREI